MQAVCGDHLESRWHGSEGRQLEDDTLYVDLGGECSMYEEEPNVTSTLKTCKLSSITSRFFHTQAPPISSSFTQDSHVTVLEARFQYHVTACISHHSNSL